MLLTRPESGPTRTSTSMSMIVGGGRNRIARLSSPRPIGWWAPLRSARLSRLHSALAPPVGPGAPGGCDLGPQADGRCRARVVRHGDRHRALVSELYAVGWRVRARPQQWVWSVFPSLGRRFAWRAAMRLCGVRRRRTVAGLWHAGCRRRRRPGRGGPGPTGWPRSSRRIDRTDVRAADRGPGVPTLREWPSVAVRPGALDAGLPGGRLLGLRAGAADVVSDGAGGALRGSG